MRPRCQEEFCPEPKYALGLCEKHYAAKKREGQPRKKYRFRMKNLMESLASGPLPDDCIRVDWVKNRPKYIVDGVGMCASRAAWILRFGDPGDLQVLHRCHDDHCVNPKHLYLSTHQQNMRDMIEAGRKAVIRTGGRHSQFTPDQQEQMRQMRREGKTPTEIAEVFQVSRQVIQYYLR